MRAKRVISYSGKDIYLPDMTLGMESEAYREHLRYLNVPICFTNGSENAVYDPKNMQLSYNMVREANPDQHYESVQIEGYGHMETFFGKACATRAFPKLLPFLEKYAHAQTTLSNSVTATQDHCTEV